MNCYICNTPLTGRYCIDGWGHNICASHLNDGTVAQCSSCTCFTLTSNHLPDGRILCSNCSNSTINSSSDLAPLSRYVVKHLSSLGFNNLKLETITVDVVSAHEIALCRNSNVDTNVKGLAVSSASYGLFCSSMKHAIHMLSHQNRTEITGTLAHEMLHAWQIQNNIYPPPEYCEGLCNLGAYYLYSTLRSPLANVLMNKIKNSPDPIYGEGFRTVLRLCQDKGWLGLIHEYKQRFGK